MQPAVGFTFDTAPPPKQIRTISASVHFRPLIDMPAFKIFSGHLASCFHMLDGHKDVELGVQSGSDM